MIEPVVDREAEMRSMLRRKYEGSLYDYAWDVLNYRAMYRPLHDDVVCNFLTNWKTTEGGVDQFIKLLLIPREHLKSTLASISLPLWCWGLDPKKHSFPCGPTTRFMLSHGKRESAVDYLREIKNHLSANDRLRWTYPDIVWESEKDADLWKQDQFNVQRGVVDRVPSMVGSGTTSSKVGFHYDWLIFDDLVFRQNVGTPELRQKTLQYFKDSMALLRRGGRVLVIGTRWHLDDLYGTLLDPDGAYAESVDALVLSSGYFTGKPIFPVSEEVPKCGWDMDRLEQKRKSMSDPDFFCQYENAPQRADGSSFKIEEIRRFRFDPDGSLPCENDLAYVMAVDPNRSTDTHNDPCAIVCGAVGDDGRLWVVDIYRGHPSGQEFIARIREMFQKWKPKLLCYETAGGQNLWMEELVRDGFGYGIRYPIKEMKRGPTKKKFDRVVAMQPLIERGHLCIPLGGDFDLMFEELKDFGFAKNDDLADALSDIHSVMYDVRPDPQHVKERKPPPSPFLLKTLMDGMDGGRNRVIRTRGSRVWRT